MPYHYPDSEELARIYRSKSSEWLCEQLTSGALTWEATSLAMEELERRGEVPPQPIYYGGDGGGGDASSDPEMGEETSKGESTPRTNGVWPRWAWLIVFVLAFASIASQGTRAHGSENQGFLWGVILLQALALSLVVAGVVSITKISSTVGVIGRIFMLALLAALLFGLWVFSLLARHGWGG